MTYVYYVTPNAKAHNLTLVEIFIYKKDLFYAYKKMCSKMHVLGECLVSNINDITIILACVLNYNEELNMYALEIAKSRVLNKYKDAAFNSDDLLKII